MPFGSEGLEDTVGLALSGGGFRATLFHLGALWRINELALLQRLARVSSVSGGSITAGVLARAWDSLDFQNGVSARFEELVVSPVRQFCGRSIDIWAIGEGLLVPWRRAADVVEGEYSAHLFGDATLQDLPDAPVFVFNSTNLQTGRSFRFMKRYMGDYLLGLVERPAIPLAKAVAASSAFPPFLSPVVIDNPGRFQEVEGSVFHSDPSYTSRLHLTDGGAYDNLGLETVWNRCRAILVSDAGAPFSFGSEVETDWIRQSVRALDIATDQSRGLRKRALIDEYQRQLRSGAYWGIDTRIADYDLPDPMPCEDDLVRQLARIATRLDRFDDTDQGRLINWGYALCDAAMRSYGRSLVPNAARPGAWPCPVQALGSP